uniref:Uncharacterized protein n=1 Tax=Chenopodium quinoa TaxID=63459 RepID=A0A803KTA6_CHEQI
MTPMGYGEYGAASGYFPSQQPNPNIWESSNVLSEEDEANEECEDDETAALISAYMNTSTDIIIGTNQKKGVFWNRVLDAYDAARESNPVEISLRTITSLKGRWMRIFEAVLKWCGSYDKARK